MKRLLNTLYVTTQDSWLRKDGANLVVELDGAAPIHLPFHLLGGIVTFGRIGLSTPLLGHCAEAGIGVTFLNEHGRFQARLEGPQSGNVLLRRAQHKATERAEMALPVAQAMIAAKLSNQRIALLRALRDHGDALGKEKRALIESVGNRISANARQALTIPTLDELRGLEGDAANAYFGCFNHLIMRDEPQMQMRGRSRRPPLDAPNAVLSFLYAILTHDCRSALETIGLDSQMGFLHRDRPGRASLALDLVEEFRTPLADRVCLTLFNRKQLSPKDFRFEPNGAVLLNDDGRKTVLTAFQERKRNEIMHPFLGEKIPLGLVPFVQAQLLARHLRGDLDGYPAYFWK